MAWYEATTNDLSLNHLSKACENENYAEKDYLLVEYLMKYDTKLIDCIELIQLGDEYMTMIYGKDIHEIAPLIKTCLKERRIHGNVTISADTCNKQRVSFSNDRPLVYVVDRSNRKGMWEQYALDRTRFHRRIQGMGPILTPVLLKHKSLVAERCEQLHSDSYKCVQDVIK